MYLYDKQCGPRSDCRSSLNWVHIVAVLTFVNYVADDLNGLFFAGALSAKIPEITNTC